MVWVVIYGFVRCLNEHMNSDIPGQNKSKSTGSMRIHTIGSVYTVNSSPQICTVAPVYTESLATVYPPIRTVDAVYTGNSSPNNTYRD